MGLAEEADLEELIRQKEALAVERDGQAAAVGALRSQARCQGRWAVRRLLVDGQGAAAAALCLRRGWQRQP